MGKYFSFDTVALTDRGRVRENNEDSVFALDTENPEGDFTSQYGIYLVADGLGGHRAGDIASTTAIETISSILLDRISYGSPQLQPLQLVKQAIEAANIEIYNRGKDDSQLAHMGTTITLGFRFKNELYLGHVGDSRAYLIRKKKMKQLTEDHSIIASLLKSKLITPDEVRTHPDRGKIFRCLGVADHVSIDIYEKLVLQNGDFLLFCTDGLTGAASDEEIFSCINKEKKSHDICISLVDMANERGGEDNISVIVVKIEKDSNQCQ